MKRRLHQVLLGLSLLGIVPGTFLGLLLAVAAVGSGIQSGFALTDLVAVPLLLAPMALSWWGARMFLRLYAGFLARIRRSLFWYYAAVTAYCGMWLVSSTFSREGATGAIFAPQEQAIGLIILLIPFLTVVFMKPDAQPERPARNEDAQQAAGGHPAGNAPL